MNERGEWIADHHVHRYHLTTNDVLAALLGLSENAVKKITGRLVRDDVNVLNAYPLPGGSHYFTLSACTCRRLGEKEDPLFKAFGAQRLVRAYGVLYYCVTRGVEKMTAAEFKADHGDLAQPGMPNPSYYFWDHSGLNYILVHHGGDAWNVAVKMRNAHKRRYAISAWKKLIDRGEFRQVLVVATDRAKETVEAKVARLDKFPARVEVLENLLDLSEVKDD